MDQHEVEHVERADRPDAFDQGRLAVPVERLKREAAGVDLAAFANELRDLVVEVLSAGKRLVAKLGEAALDAKRDARAVKQDRGLEPFPLKPRRLQQIDEADRAFERDGVKGDERLFARLRLDVLEYLLLVIDEEVALLVGRAG